MEAPGQHREQTGTPSRVSGISASQHLRLTDVSEPGSVLPVIGLPLLPNVALFCLFSDPAIVNGVYWSESLNKVFVDNFDRDPSLIWQYFGSAKGFFRQYPGKCA